MAAASETIPTYKLVPMFTVDEYKLQDVLPYVLETGARTEEELVAVLLRIWLEERDFFARGLEVWLYQNELPMSAWRDALELTEEGKARVRAIVATEEGRRGFLDAIQSDKQEPVFIVLPGSGSGNFAVEMLFHLAMESGGVRSV